MRQAPIVELIVNQVIITACGLKLNHVSVVIGSILK